MVTFINLPKRGPSKSEQLAQGISRAAVGTAQHLYKQEKKNKQQEKFSRFLDEQFGIKMLKMFLLNFKCKH